MNTNRKEFLKKLGLSTVTFGLSSVLPLSDKKDQSSGNKKLKLEGRNDFYISNRKPLVTEPFAVLPIGAIQPKGWLLEQLKKQREGINGAS